MNKKKTLLSIVLCVLFVMGSSLSVGASGDSVPTINENVTISITDATESTKNDNTTTPTEGNYVPYPTDIQLVQQGERNFLHKTYTVAADYDVNQLVEKPFIQAGYKYTFSEIIQREYIPGSTSKTVSEEKTADSKQGDKEEILGEYEDVIPYSDAEGYKGDLSLQESSLTITEESRETYSYTVSESKQYPGLTSNDTSTIPKSISKNGLALSLGNISWETTGSEHYGYSEIPTGYTATAYYSAPATGSKVSGYISTVNYSGEVTKETPGKSIYTIVYEGEKVIVPFNVRPFLITGSLLVLGTIIFLVTRRMRRNVTIYTIQDGVPVLYEKQRINPKNPVLYLNHIGNTGIRLVFEKSYLKKSLDQTIFIIGKRENYRFELDTRLIYDLEPSVHDGESDSIDAGKAENTDTERGMSLNAE